MNRGTAALRHPAALAAVRTCRGCGCDDNHACMTSDGPCAWVLCDIETPTGICSACAIEAGWDPRFMLLVSLGAGEASSLVLP